MTTCRQTSLAWHNLSHDPWRFTVSVAGIAFAVVLVFMEVGFWHALLDCTVELVRALDADLVVLSKSRYTIIAPAAFNRRELDVVAGCPGVASAVPLYLENHVSVLRDESSRLARKVRVIGFDPGRPGLLVPGVLARLDALKQPDTALIDDQTHGVDPARLDQMRPRLMGRSLRLAGTFHLGIDFVVEGTLVMSDRNFLKFYADPRRTDAEPRRADLGLVRLGPGADRDSTRAAVRAALPADLVVLPKEDLIGRERWYWQTRSPIGYVFGLGMAMGFVVGVMICYQVLSSGISSHLAEYATLKAVGYGRPGLVRFVLDESLILALAGFVPGWLLSIGLYAWLAALTGLPMRQTPERVALVFVVTVAMCLCSGLLAVRKLFAADPAELFK